MREVEQFLSMRFGVEETLRQPPSRRPCWLGLRIGVQLRKSGAHDFSPGEIMCLPILSGDKLYTVMSWMINTLPGVEMSVEGMRELYRMSCLSLDERRQGVLDAMADEIMQAEGVTVQ